MEGMRMKVVDVQEELQYCELMHLDLSSNHGLYNFKTE